MREFKKRRSRREEIFWLCVRGVGALLLLLVAAAAVHAAWDMYGKLSAASQGQEEAEAQLASLQAEKKGVSASVAQLSTARGVEAEVRQRFGVVKPGEGEIEIVRDQGSATTTDDASKHWWSRVFHALFVW